LAALGTERGKILGALCLLLCAPWIITMAIFLLGGG
jgi:hypothetical protein